MEHVNRRKVRRQVQPFSEMAVVSVGLNPACSLPTNLTPITIGQDCLVHYLNLFLLDCVSSLKAACEKPTERDASSMFLDYP
ncbi:hypothetical protein KCU65_g64, partial [Aureobasidium melanogenum]